VVKKPGAGSFLSLLQEKLEMEESLEISLDGAEKDRIKTECVAVDLGQEFRHPIDKKTPPRVDWKACAALWQERGEWYEAIQGRLVFVTPSLLKRIDEDQENRPALLGGGDRKGEKGKLIGRLAHRFLEVWDFSDGLEIYRDRLTDFLATETMSGFPRGEIFEELVEIFRVFFRSSAYKEISQSLIIGREIPFLMPWDGQVMDGVIDLVYELEGKLYIGEYKTDRVCKEDLKVVAKRYRYQTEVYPEAIRKALKREVAGVRLIFLRIGESVLVG